MGFTPRGRGGFRGGRGGGRFDNANQGPPEEVVEVGTYHHSCQEDIVCKLTNEKIPHFNAFVYLENKEEVGKVDEIFGPIKDAFYMDPYKFLPLDRVLNPNAFRGRGRGSRGGRGGDNRGIGRGGRGDFRGGRGSRGGDFRGGRGGDFRGGRGGDSRGGRGGESRGGRGGDFRGGRGGGRGDFRGGRDSGRGDFRGGRDSNRGEFRGRGRGDYRGGRGEHGGKRASDNFSSGTENQGKKIRFDSQE
ncbi:H/ACA ribonucleoprotein complex subunit [Fasciola hepatica]|uniref:H/ACA ribonucleoprotein complex subunit n=1 Tax=Fasciola hepatica TaxID=6192 RepID=A0A4E0RV00_FASHE|nr:H/ACA ribonucleoprotein complex subunit [Fasciola hepatica]